MALTGRQEAFRVDSIASGFDHQRSQFVSAFGHYVANSTTEFQAGMLVDMNSSQEIIVSVGVNSFGWTKYNKTSSFYGCVVGEYIQLNGVVATNLAHGNIRTGPVAGGASEGIRVAAALTGAAWTEGTGNDYLVSLVNGTVTRDAASTIPDGDYVFVNYQYLLTSQEIQDNGHNFWNFDDDVTIQGGKVTVITGPCTIFTTAYDSNKTFTIGQDLYAGTTTDVLEGFVTDHTGSGSLVVGKVIQLPTADDPFMGIKSNF